MRVIHLPLDRAEVAALRLEEDARAVGAPPQDNGLAMRQIVDGLEQIGAVRRAVDVELSPLQRDLQRAIERRLDGDRPPGRAADPGVPAPVRRVEAENVHHDGEAPSEGAYSVRSAVIGSTCMARRAGTTLAMSATSVSTAGTAMNVTGSIGRT